MSEVNKLLVVAGAAVATMDELPASIRALVDAAGQVLEVDADDRARDRSGA